jgi:hypothetical protein
VQNVVESLVYSTLMKKERKPRFDISSNSDKGSAGASKGTASRSLEEGLS